MKNTKTAAAVAVAINSIFSSLVPGCGMLSGGESVQVNTHGSTIRDHERRIVLLERASQLQSKALALLGAKVDGQGLDLKALAAKVDMVAADLRQTQTDFASKADLSEALNAAVGSLMAAIVRLEAKDSEIEETVAANHGLFLSALEELLAEVQRLNTADNEMNTELFYLSSVYEQLSGQVSDQGETLDSLRQRLTRLERKNRRLANKVRALRSTMNSSFESVYNEFSNVWQALETIELTPGPMGPQGLPGVNAATASLYLVGTNCVAISGGVWAKQTGREFKVWTNNTCTGSALGSVTTTKTVWSNRNMFFFVNADTIGALLL